MASSSELQVIQQNIPENFSIPVEQLLEIASLFRKLSEEQHDFQLRRAVVLLARSLDESRDRYPSTISAMNATFTALLNDLDMEKPKNQDEFLKFWLLILKNAFIRVQAGQLDIEVLMEAMQSIGNAYRT